MTDDKSDMTDDWMDPPRRWDAVGQAQQQQKPRPFIIQRAHAPPIPALFGLPGPEWRLWSEHDTSQERDAELNRLHKEHPRWLLRPRNLDALGHIIEPYGP